MDERETVVGMTKPIDTIRAAIANYIRISIEAQAGWDAKCMHPNDQCEELSEVTRALEIAVTTLEKLSQAYYEKYPDGWKTQDWKCVVETDTAQSSQALADIAAKLGGNNGPRS